MNLERDISSSDIAVIGMSARFPGAAGLEEFWSNLCQGREGIRVIADNELLRHGVDPQVVGASDYVKAVADVRGVEFFDNGFFGFTPRDAEIMDPQLRLLLECAWSTIEHAGYSAEDYPGAIGVFAGAAPNSYFIENLVPNQELMRTLAGPLSSLAIFAASDALSTMVSFKLNLRGPSITVQTACSTSLVAVHLACQSLLSRESDMVLAGGVNLNIPQERGYLYQKGMILSPDGHCRPFDADAAGTVFGGGVGLVLLKRVADALADGDCIHAVIKGSAVNNDGSTKAGFTAPSVVGQSAAIADALAIADVSAASISYVEAHGTGTALGDPIEIEALTRAFRQSTERNRYCGIGSVKSNIGHLDRAAGIASFIKTVLSLKRRQIPATLHFKQPNPNIDFDVTPFFVVDKLTEWKSDNGPRRAVVNSVGFGGTNACVVLEEPPPARSSGSSRPYQLLSLSARTESALGEATHKLAKHFDEHPAICLSDAAYTLHIGRHPFDFRCVAVSRDVADAAEKLRSPKEKGVFTGRRVAAVPSVVFMFPGQGAQYARMGAELYRTESMFRSEVDRCTEVLQPFLKSNLRTLLFPAPGLEEEAGQQLVQTRFTQPALFVIEYALAKLWMSWAIQPAAMIGHSVGEYVAACLAGVFTLEDALSLVAQRAALVQAQPSGAMLSVRLPEKDVLPLLNTHLAIAAINSPNLCVVSGPHDAIDGLEKQLESNGVMARRLHTSHAFHSPMMEPVLAPFTEHLRRVKFSEPRIPYVSNVTAAWITTEQATSPEYWAGHVRQTVRFADGLTALFGGGPRLFLEVGPGQTLGQMVRQHPRKRADTVVLASLSASRDASRDMQAILEALGKAWTVGVVVDWRAFYSNEERCRVALPTYPFDKRKFWVEPPRVAPATVAPAEIPQALDGSTKEATEKGTTSQPDASRHAHRESQLAVPLRVTRITDKLRGILQELSGMCPSDVDESATFLEMGFDSLFLAQFSRRLETEFGISVDFGQLADQLATLSALSHHLSLKLPLGATVELKPDPRVGVMAAQAGTMSRYAHIAERLRQILQGLSGISQSDLTSSATFLEMGFDSLFLAGFSRKLEEEFGISVNFGQLADSSLNDLALHLDQKLPPTATLSLPAHGGNSSTAPVSSAVIEQLQEQIRVLTQQVQMLSNGRAGGQPQGFMVAGLPAPTPAEEAEIVTLPITAGQREIWLASHLGDDAARAYNEVVVIRLRGSLHVGVLQASLQDLVDRHDSLRITISADSEQQFIHPKRYQELPLTDLSAMAAPERESRLREITDDHNRTLFDLVNGPLMKVHLIRLRADEHVLLLAFHHVVIDGWSTHVVVSDLSRLYSAKIRGGAGDLAPSMQYRDYVKWYYEAETARKREGDEQYWLKSFADLPASVELPSKGSRPLERSYRTGNANIVIDGELYRRLKKASASSSCTLFHFLLATFKVWVHRITGQHDIVVGIPIAGQLASNLQRILGCERLVGHCSNVVPIRSELSDTAKFVDFLADIKRKVLEARAHESFTYGELVQKLNPPRDSSRVPFVSVTFNLNDDPKVHWEDLQVDVEVPPLSCIFFDLEINIWESANGLYIAWYYVDDLFDSETVKSWLSQWKTVMVSAAETSLSQLDRLELLGKAERDRILVEWNKTEADFPHHSCVQQLFEAQVARAPERTALRSGVKALSYAELDALANRMAQALRARGIGRGQRVGLCVERGADMVAAMLGILKAGAAYVPLDPAFPPERLRFMAEDAQLALLVSTTDLGGCFALSRERQLLLDSDVPALASPDQRLSPDAELDARPEDPAYVIYTSGSTGKPKGVVVPHRAVVNFLTSMAREPGLTADDVLVAVTTLSFDIAVLELQLPLTLGATVVIASREEAIDGRALSALLEQHRATVMQATPVTWRLLLEAGWKGRKDFKALVGGEALPKDLAEQLITRGVELWNMYGPTETTVWSTCARITDTSNGITIGKPIANTTVYVLDAQKNPCPIGVPGELCIGGDGVTQGYWNRPELTAERFIPDPFSATPGDTLYRTGDRARWRNDGTLEHLGRFDDQAKVRGFRIELGEIEAVLAEHPEVRQAAVHLWRAKANDVRIVACCVPARAGVWAPISLRKYLRARLPEYMIPQYFVPVREIPLTPNGKIDRSKLPAPALAEVHSHQHEAPSDPIEATIAEIWTNLIGSARPIGRADKFFEMGGHSLLALRALQQIENKLGVRLDFRVLFQESLAEIATKCRSEPFLGGGGNQEMRYSN